MADIPGYTPKKVDRSSSSSGPTAFWPFLLVALSLCAILIWQLIVANEVNASYGAQLRDQQVKLVEQSKRMQAGLQKFARDLIEVSKSDPDAKAIVDKYRGLVSPRPARQLRRLPHRPASRDCRARKSGRWA